MIDNFFSMMVIWNECIVR